MTSELITPTYKQDESSPEAVLQFLSEHRHRAERRKKRRPVVGRGRKTVLLGLVATIVLLGGSAFIWGNFESHGRAGTTAPRRGALKKSSHPAANAALRNTRTAKARSGIGTTKMAKTAELGSAHEAWNQGLQQWSDASGRTRGGFYYRWIRSGLSCASYATYGCWKLEVTVRRGCPQGVIIVVDELKNGAIVGEDWGFGRRVAARKPSFVEVDAGHNGVRGRLGSMACRS